MDADAGVGTPPRPAEKQLPVEFGLEREPPRAPRAAAASGALVSGGCVPGAGVGGRGGGVGTAGRGPRAERGGRGAARPDGLTTRRPR